jgi:hypothetical protein
MIRPMTIELNLSLNQCLNSRVIWRSWFRDPSTWRPWRAFLDALNGIPLSEDQLELYQQCTGRREVPEGGFTEAWLICGRRSGKSFILAVIAVYLAIFKDWRPYLSPGETGTIKIIATDRKQAGVIYRYCRALLAGPKSLRDFVLRDTEQEITLANGLVIEIQTASFRAIRGYTIVAALADEIAFWRNEETSANPDAEILGSLRPAMATIPKAMLLCASSPYARRGVMWDTFRLHYGREESPVLVWKAPTLTMNPTVPQRIIDEAYEKDPAWAAAEYGAEFRSDLESFVSPEAVAACVASGIRERPPQLGIRYSAFIDPSGGSGTDSMTLAIAHRDKHNAVLDLLREIRPVFSPENAVDEFAPILKQYGIAECRGDHFAGDWPKARFRAHGIHYDYEKVEKKSDIYLGFLPLLNSGRVVLLDNQRAIAQLCSLDRVTGRGGGKDTVDHPRFKGSVDDLANVMAGVLYYCNAKKGIGPVHPDVLARSYGSGYGGGVYGFGSRSPELPTLRLHTFGRR